MSSACFESVLMIVGLALWVDETLVVRLCACAVSLDSAWARETGRFRNRRFKFDKRSQLFIRAHNETLSVVAMCVSNEDRSPARVHSCDAAPTPTGFAEIVSDDSQYFTRSGFRPGCLY
jgi:hypothetical protein